MFLNFVGENKIKKIVQTYRSLLLQIRDMLKEKFLKFS